VFPGFWFPGFLIPWIPDFWFQIYVLLGCCISWFLISGVFELRHLFIYGFPFPWIMISWFPVFPDFWFPGSLCSWLPDFWFIMLSCSGFLYFLVSHF
jgi:hypothetical protein